MCLAWATDETELWLSFFKTEPKSLFWAPHLCTKNWVRSMIGLIKKPLPICQSGWKEIQNALESFGGPEQGSRGCFAEVNNRGQISSATHSRVCQVLTRRPRNWPFFFSFLFQRLFAMKAELPVLPMFLVSSFSFQEVEKEIFVSLCFRRNCANLSIA